MTSWVSRVVHALHQAEDSIEPGELEDVPRLAGRPGENDSPCRRRACFWASTSAASAAESASSAAVRSTTR